jgi:hypothetical protein
MTKFTTQAFSSKLQGQKGEKMRVKQRPTTESLHLRAFVHFSQTPCCDENVPSGHKGSRWTQIMGFKKSGISLIVGAYLHFPKELAKKGF